MPQTLANEECSNRMPFMQMAAMFASRLRTALATDTGNAKPADTAQTQSRPTPAKAVDMSEQLRSVSNVDARVATR